MSRTRKQKQQQKKKDPAAEDCAKGVQLVWANPALAAMEVKLCREEECEVAPRQGLVRVSSNGRVHLNPTRRAEPDGWCDALRVRREHAYLIPQGARLPFTARGPVFRVS
ncbi:hypothetical protein ACFW5W_04415 [Streptomyces sp. NPDC058783]|uniref:hypothetical protein n=1 Tax=Streptomyces sp. NPDC058783 TaxID=3346633 RepID=UPI00369B2436